MSSGRGQEPAAGGVAVEWLARSLGAGWRGAGACAWDEKADPAAHALNFRASLQTAASASADVRARARVCRQQPLASAVLLMRSGGGGAHGRAVYLRQAACVLSVGERDSFLHRC